MFVSLYCFSLVSLLWTRLNYREHPSTSHSSTFVTIYPHSSEWTFPNRITHIQIPLDISHKMPALKFQHRAEPINAEDRKIGPIPLPWFIPMCVFAPFFLTFIAWVFYQQTVKRYQNKKLLQAQQEQQHMAQKEVETQMQQFIGSSANSANSHAAARGFR